MGVTPTTYREKQPTARAVPDSRSPTVPASTPGISVSVCIPARNEAATVGELVASVLEHPGATEVLVLDHASWDDTADIAAAAGASVLPADDILAGFGPALGKGDVLWRSVHVAQGEVIVWLDADLRSYSHEYLTRLIKPLADDDAIAMVRPDYPRTFHGQPTGGGRVTESTARPALRSWHPHLAHIRQPLAGEYAIRRAVATSVPFEIDYGVEIGLLIDVAERCGTASIAQVPLPPRVHRNRPDHELREPADQVLRTALSRVGLRPVKARPPLRTVASAAVG